MNVGELFYAQGKAAPRKWRAVALIAKDRYLFLQTTKNPW